MSDIKISQLASVTSLLSPDLLPISKNLGSNIWESKSITAQDVFKSFGSSNRLLKVSKSGVRDADTIKDAVTQAVALVPTQVAPVAIQVFSGAYTEDNPIAIPPWVTIFSTAGYYSNTITPSNDGDIFTVTGNSLLDGLTIIGGVAFSNVAYKSTTHTNSQISNCLIMNCHTGVLSDNGSINATFVTGLSMARVFDKFLSSVSGGFLVATSCGINRIITRPNYGYYSNGTDSELYLFSCVTNNCVEGIYANNDGYIDIFSGHFEDCDHSIRIGSVGSSHVKCMGCVIDESDIYDLYIESATARFSYMGHLDSSKFSIVSGAEVNIVADDENTEGGLITGKAALQGKVSIGIPGAISLGEDIQLNIGEGSAFTEDAQGNPIVEFWSYDATQPSGSRFTRFTNNAGTQLNSSGSALIVGCKYAFPAIRLDVNVAAVLGSGNIVTEYWNGTSWIGVSVAAYRRSDFARRANHLFQNVETQFVECSQLLFDNGDWQDDIDILDEIPSWDAGDPFYAIRYSNNGALTSGMQFADGKVKPHSLMVSTSGKKANFGLYRTDKVLYIDSATFIPDPVNPPTFVNLQMSPNIAYSNLPNFTKANNVSQISTAFIIPSDLDTSSPLQIFIDGIAVDSSVGNVSTSMYVARIDSTNPPISLPITDEEFAQVTATPGSANAFMTVMENLDVSHFGENDLLLLSFARYSNDGSDTYTGDYIVGDMTLRYQSKFV